MRILIVDDHLPTLDLMRLALTSLGHSVTSATTVTEALERLVDASPDVILSDLTFPSDHGGGKNGHDLAREVRSRPDRRGVGLLAVTGAASAAERRAAIDSGFDEVVVKPFDLGSLIDQIDAFDPGR